MPVVARQALVDELSDDEIAMAAILCEDDEIRVLSALSAQLAAQNPSSGAPSPS